MIDLLKLVAQRTQAKPQGYGISLASSYLKTLGDCLYRPCDPHAKAENAPDKAKIQAALRKAENTLVYRNFDMDVVSGIVEYKTETGSTVQEFGKAQRKDPGNRTPNACMDFEHILTSSRKDRDQDILEPEGAELDEKMPLLWQHFPEYPIGKYIQTIGRDKDFIKTHCAIMDNAFGRDCAELAAFGALRISHGFHPTEWEMIQNDSGDFDGFHIRKYKIHEISLVSVPSNVDAVITAYSREKLHTPLVKGWAEELYQSRKKQARGIELPWQQPLQIINNINLPGNKMLVEDNTTQKPPEVKTKTTKEEEKPKEGEEEEEAEGKGKDATAGTVSGLVALLDSIGDDLPKQAEARVGVIRSVLEKLQEDLAALKQAIGSVDNVSEISKAVGALEASIMEGMITVQEEAAKIAGIAEVPESVCSKMDELSGLAGEIVASLDSGETEEVETMTEEMGEDEDEIGKEEEEEEDKEEEEEEDKEEEDEEEKEGDEEEEEEDKEEEDEEVTGLYGKEDEEEEDKEEEDEEEKSDSEEEDKEEDDEGKSFSQAATQAAGVLIHLLSQKKRIHPDVRTGLLDLL